jgi:hypothetical protein
LFLTGSPDAQLLGEGVRRHLSAVAVGVLIGVRN